ncbi:PepSY-associated TM helix domain-containing protein [Undibacterium sp. Di27W]|uniref:PepSY-associated TM helix domain-containing protein n=1 Tax=Undibacterium sp. Di27W TaxID=3413036 RepID=UPI003BF0ECF5
MKIRSDILRIYQSLHTWVGISAGLLLFIGFFAGALTMFKRPLDHWVSPPAPVAIMVSEQKIDSLAQQALAQHPAARKGFIMHLGEHENTAATMSWTAGKPGRELDFSGKQWTANLDQEGKLQAKEELPSILAQMIDMLHRTGGIPGEIGDEYLGGYLMGVAGILYFLALVSGVILLLPTMVKDFFALRPGKNRKRFWLDAHNIIGIASLPYHIVISLTVIVFAFHDQFYDSLAEVVYKNQAMFGTPPPAAAKPYAAKDMLPLTAIISKVKAEAGDSRISEIQFFGLESPRPMARVALVNPRYLVQGPEAGYLVVHPYTGSVINASMLPGKESTWSAIVGPFFSLHFGSYGGDMMRWVYFAFGLSGAFLFYSGNLLWLEKRRKVQRPNQVLPMQTLSTRLMAAGTVGVCLGTVSGVCFTLVAGKLFAATAENINFVYLFVYYSVFLGALAWAYLRGAARSSVDLLWLCVIAALSIPCSSAFMALRSASNGSLTGLGVELVAIAMALAFIYAACKTGKRIRDEAKDSVWSLQAST